MPIAVAVNGDGPTPVATPGPGAKKQKLSKNQMKRERKKQKKAAVKGQEDKEGSVPVEEEKEESIRQEKETNESSKVKDELDSVTEGALHDLSISEIDFDEAFAEYRIILDRFDVRVQEEDKHKGEVLHNDDDMPDEEDEEREEPKLSKKERKSRNKLSVAELKALVKRPECVEWTDTSAHDPRLLVHLKSYRNCVPVPSHWSLKREYLSSKRGVEKPPFELPKFIKDTGIMEMRDSAREREEAQSLKSKMRERVQPKMGKLDIDYQKLHDAFFRFQTKPQLTMYGEVYYEGKEYETNLKDRRPGELSEDLKEALNIPPGAPPPWLINMQRFGPPPSYPSLKIPGLNAPIPPGAQWGFHPGGYGKPPTDEFNRPLYGDVFGVLQAQPPTQSGEPVEKSIWGELQEPEESEEEDEESEEEEEEEEDVAEGVATPAGLETPSGMVSSVPSEFEAPEFIEIRKHKNAAAPLHDDDEEPKSLYTILPEQHIKAKGFFGGQHAYDVSKGGGVHTNLPVLGQEDQQRKRKKPGDVDVAIDPSALEEDGLSSEVVKQKYEQAQDQAKRDRQGFQEDLSDMIAAESRKRQRREEENAKKKKDKYRF
ncbi:hypothetical protein BGX38DRAFT_1170307 [Terfezia claveryi]|nr:hypothetical protein BGX38DRAFT_1170307 [Terfezia claveryi]